MAADTGSLPNTNGASPAARPIQIAFPLQNSPAVVIHIHLTILATAIVLFVTTGSGDGAVEMSSLGSFVYAMPDRYNPTQPLSTTLYSHPSSLDFATRLAKVLAKRTGKAVHVGSSASFASAAEGGTIEEELGGFKGVVNVVLDEIERTQRS